MHEILIGRDENGNTNALPLKVANRHGLITGATGTGKTITLQVLAESFSNSGVPVVLADVKGDLSGLAQAGQPHPKIEARVTHNQISDFTFKKYPVSFWDIYAEKGLPLCTTVSEMGPILLARILDLNDVQSDLVSMVFKFADDQGLLLLDLKDFKSLLNELAENASELQMEYGNISKASVAAIIRRVVNLQSGGGDLFFSEPALKLQHLLQTDFSGQGVINIIDAQKLMHDKRLYSSFLMWILSELFETLPEVGDAEKPKLVFFFDEAHLLFDDAPKYLLEKLETVIRLIRSKGVGIYFISQSPSDIPESILSQLGHKIQHGLRASSEKDRKAIRSVAQNYPSSKDFDVEEAILSLGTGESLVSTLDIKGVPQNVLKVLNVPPSSQIGPISDEKRKELISLSPLSPFYQERVDRESAYEILQKRNAVKSSETQKAPAKKATSGRQGAGEAFLKSLLRSVGTSLGRAIARGVMGSLKK